MITEQTSASVLYDEHTAISHVLDYVDQAVRLIESGKRVDPSLFADFQEFFARFVGQCHHGKEEQLAFPALRGALPDQGPALIDTLESEHARGAKLAAAFAVAVEGYAAGGQETVPALAEAARAYAAFLRAHIQRENEQLIPLLAKMPTDQTAIMAAFDRFEEDVMGKGTHERLHQMIDTLGPRLAREEAG
ncbi:MAG TPA: hemerythrin domain-containing protein, partial [Chloroflexota bacterium]